MIRVRVPATAANLGPGFDVLGLALALYNEVLVDPAGPGADWSVTVEGEGVGELAGDETNLTVQAMRDVAERLGRELPPLSVTCRNAIPVGRGLGSSAAAIVGGVVAADAVLEAGSSADDLLALAARLEGHGDNVAAALFGGFTVFYESADGPRALALEPSPELAVVVVVPAEPVATSAARAVLPKALTYEDATFQMARVTMMAVAVTAGRVDLLAEGAADRMHQPQRRWMEPGYEEAERALLEAGALAVSLSGAGPSVLGWVPAREAETVREGAATALGGGRAGRPDVIAPGIDRAGVAVSRDES